MDTYGYGGRRLSKTASVHTNDKRKPITSIIITGIVDKFFTLSERIVKLQGAVGEKINRTITITASEKYTFKIIDSRAKIGKDIRYELKEVKKSGGENYLLYVENLKKHAGRYYDVISLITNKKSLPEILIRVQGDITDIGAKSHKRN